MAFGQACSVGKPNRIDSVTINNHTSAQEVAVCLVVYQP
jgi:hypothetical protein